MGATTFAQVEVAANAQTAYENAVRRATYDHGHDPYNGTISTTRGFEFKSVKFENEEQVRQWIELTINNTEKWGKAVCAVLPNELARRDVPKGMLAFIFVGWAAE